VDFPYSESNDRDLIEPWLVIWDKNARPTNDQVIELAKRFEAGLYAEELLANSGPNVAELQSDYEWIAEDGELARRELVMASIGYAVKYSLQNEGVFSLDFNAACKVIDYAIEHYDHTKSSKFSDHLKYVMNMSIDSQDRFDDPTFDWADYDKLEGS
jgi:hypothetical protein